MGKVYIPINEAGPQFETSSGLKAWKPIRLYLEKVLKCWRCALSAILVQAAASNFFRSLTYFYLAPKRVWGGKSIKASATVHGVQPRNSVWEYYPFHRVVVLFLEYWEDKLSFQSKCG